MVFRTSRSVVNAKTETEAELLKSHFSLQLIPSSLEFLDREWILESVNVFSFYPSHRG